MKFGLFYSLMAIAGLSQGSLNGCDVLQSSGLQREVDHGVAETDSVIRTVILRLNDVGR